MLSADCQTVLLDVGKLDSELLGWCSSGVGLLSVLFSVPCVKVLVSPHLLA